MPLETRIYARTDSTARNLEAWAKRAGESEIALEEVMNYLEERERTLFETQGVSSGRAWEPDKPITSESKAHAGFGSQINEATLALYNSLTDREDDNAIREVAPGWLRFGTRLRYAEFLQRGTSKMPARRPIDLNFYGSDRYAIMSILQSWISGRARAGLKIGIRMFRP